MKQKQQRIHKQHEQLQLTFKKISNTVICNLLGLSHMQRHSYSVVHLLKLCHSV